MIDDDDDDDDDDNDDDDDDGDDNDDGDDDDDDGDDDGGDDDGDDDDGDDDDGDDDGGDGDDGDDDDDGGDDDGDGGADDDDGDGGDDALPMVRWPLRGGKERLHTSTGCANTNWPNHFPSLFRRKRTCYQHGLWMRRWGNSNNKISITVVRRPKLRRWRMMSTRTRNQRGGGKDKKRS